MEIQEQNTRNHSVVTVGDWILTMILMLIPIVNFIMLLDAPWRPVDLPLLGLHRQPHAGRNVKKG